MTKLGIFYQNAITFLIKNILEKTARNKAFTTWVRFLFCSARAVVVQPVFNHKAHLPIERQWNSHCIQLYWKCRTVKVQYKVLWFFLANTYIKTKQNKKSPQSFSHTQTHHCFKTIWVSVTAVARVIKKERDTVGSDWHTGCYNQPTLSVTDGK